MNTFQQHAFNDLSALVWHRHIDTLWNISITVNNVFHTFYRQEKVYSFDAFEKIREIKKGELVNDELWKFKHFPEITRYLNEMDIIVWAGKDCCGFYTIVIADTSGNAFMSAYTLDGIHENHVVSEELMAARSSLTV